MPLVAIVGGIVLGAMLGASLRFAIGSTQPGSLIPAGTMEALTTAGLVVVLFVVGAVLLVPRSTRRGGVLTLLATSGFVVGLGLGLAFGPTDQPTPELPGEMTAAQMQGFVTLGGAVEATELRATGTCDATQDLRVDAIATVTPWTSGTRARLSLVPGRDRATISVDLADGSKPETVTAPANLQESRAAAGFITGRSMTATFRLANGPLTVYAEWVCPDDIEAGYPKG